MRLVLRLSISKCKLRSDPVRRPDTSRARRDPLAASAARRGLPRERGLTNAPWPARTLRPCNWSVPLSPWYSGTVRRDTVIAVIRAHLLELRQRFGVRDLSVFGSVARDEATGTSDVDVLVEFDGPTTFDGYFGLKERLEEVLGTRVDLATPAMLKPRLKVEVERQGVRVA